MFLDTLRLNNFRSFEDEQICWEGSDDPSRREQRRQKQYH